VYFEKRRLFLTLSIGMASSTFLVRANRSGWLVIAHWHTNRWHKWSGRFISLQIYRRSWLLSGFHERSFRVNLVILYWRGWIFINFLGNVKRQIFRLVVINLSLYFRLFREWRLKSCINRRVLVFALEVLRRDSWCLRKLLRKKIVWW
jgi:hypothetical protein